MTTAVWRPFRPARFAYPVLGVEHYGYLDGLGDIVFEAPDGSRERGFVRLRDIEVRPRSIVRALTAGFQDHSRPGCGCGERGLGISHPSATAQAPGTGDVPGVPKPQ